MHLRTGEHEDIKKASEPAKHLKINRDHGFTWKILAHAPRNGSNRKILEAFFKSMPEGQNSDPGIVKVHVEKGNDFTASIQKGWLYSMNEIQTE